MTIQELANEANVTPRTIRYYVEQGILPAPQSPEHAANLPVDTEEEHDYEPDRR